MRLAIVGSRDYPDMEAVRQYVMSLPDDTIVVSGGARGVDRMAEATARARGLHVQIYHADWNGIGKRAGFERNHLIVKNCDEMVAFWDGTSKGTAHSIRIARDCGKLMKVIRPGVDS